MSNKKHLEVIMTSNHQHCRPGDPIGHATELKPVPIMELEPAAISVPKKKPEGPADQVSEPAITSVSVGVLVEPVCSALDSCPLCSSLIN